MTQCRMEECGAPVLAQALCNKHYKRMLRHGDPAYERTPADITANRARRHADKRERLNAIKLERGCDECGYRRCAAALQFHHRDRAEKAFGLAQNLQRAWDVVLAEIAKCKLLCANCHAEHTAEWVETEVRGQPRSRRRAVS